jgi:hypothetical protein
VFPLRSSLGLSQALAQATGLAGPAAFSDFSGRLKSSASLVQPHN